MSGAVRDGEFVPFPTITAETPAPRFRFLVEDIISGVLLGEVPLSDAVMDDPLNRPGSLSASLPVDHPKATSEWLDEGRRAIYVERDGVILFGGPLWGVDRPLGDRTLRLTVGGWLGWFDHRQIWVDRTFTNTDQFSIFKGLVDDAQDNAVLGTGASLGITVTWSALSGVLRTRGEYLAHMTKNLGEALRQIAATEDGFDFSMVYALNPATDRIDKSIRLHYPRKGRDTGFLFQTGGNITRWGVSRDAERMAWRVRGWGDGFESDRLRSVQIAELQRGVYPMLDADIRDGGSATEQATLDENTVETLARIDHPLRLPVVEVNPMLYPRFGDWATGDTVGLRIDDGYGSVGVDSPMSVRIIGYRLDCTTDRPLLVLEPT